MPDELLERIEGYKELLPNFVPMFIRDDEAILFRVKLVEYLKSVPTATIVTTRCDIRFIEIIQENIKSGQKYVLSFPIGYQFDVKTGIMRVDWFKKIRCGLKLYMMEMYITQWGQLIIMII